MMKFSYTNVMIAYDLFATFQTINVFGLSILYPFVAIGMTVALSLANVMLLYCTMKRKQVV
ncbi:hypothetical protein MHI37_04475 [Paenibacillus sp. FSL H8-0548]|uniref:hypothetical protein n=1 Tax=Paenibacillus sp. FSL H8-0548 TaxID=1920422 RepID=UPI00117F3BE2|nr:hypothetical protein [Paenibacillus sp. FSL H8-0548]